MPRYILIDSNSGFIWGDTADLKGFDGSNTDEEAALLQAAKLLDESLGVHGRVYSHAFRDPLTSETYYRMYRADVNGSEVIGAVYDGQDDETIHAIVLQGEFCGVVMIRDPEESEGDA